MPEDRFAPDPPAEFDPRFAPPPEHMALLQRGRPRAPAEPDPPALAFAKRHAAPLVIGATLLFLLIVTHESVVTLPPGVLVPDAPRQVLVSELEEPPLPFKHPSDGELGIYPLATYVLDAKVLSKERYRQGEEARISPWDLALGWQLLSDQKQVDEIEFSQSMRWYHFKPGPKAISGDVALLMSANTHTIPASDDVREVLDDVCRGDIIHLEGYLVEVRNEVTGWKWRSSLSRKDRGAHACEVFYIERAKIVTPRS